MERPKVFIKPFNGFYWFEFEGNFHGPYDSDKEAKEVLDKLFEEAKETYRQLLIAI